jgi:hypothetical protein
MDFTSRNSFDVVDTWRNFAKRVFTRGCERTCRLAALAGMVIVSANWQRGRRTRRVDDNGAYSREISEPPFIGAGLWLSVIGRHLAIHQHFGVNRFSCPSSRFNSIIIIIDLLSPGISLMMCSNTGEDVSSELRVKDDQRE